MCSKVLEISSTILVYSKKKNILLHRISFFLKQAPLYLQAYLWEDDKAMVEWLTEQIREDSIDNAVSDNIRCLQREHVLQQVRRHVLGALALQSRGNGVVYTNKFKGAGLSRPFLDNIDYRRPGGGGLFDMKVVNSYVFLRTYYLQKRSKGKMLNMLLLIRENVLLFDKNNLSKLVK